MEKENEFFVVLVPKERERDREIVLFSIDSLTQVASWTLDPDWSHSVISSG